jgi:molybdopterin-containing oxidoreductase family iron-sulfur binding subunit
MSDDFNPNAKNSIDLAAARAKLDSASAPRMWQSLEELSSTPKFEEFRDFEFPPSAGQGNDGIDRRDVLKLMAASAALAGLSACTKLPTEKIVPYVKPPEEILAGRPLFYATSLFEHGVATGVLVESHTGRPTKIEGNSEHPGSLGSSDIYNQASILQFWDPDRSQSVILEGRVSTWSDFAAEMGNYRTRLAPNGSGMRILTETVTSPTLGAQMKALLAQYPQAKWHQWEPSGAECVREGARLAFGRPVNTVYHFDKADVIVSLDADFLTCGAGHVRYARDFGSRRDLAAGASSNLNRLYVAESMPTATGSVADHRLPVRSADIDDLARQLAAAAGVAVPPSTSASAKIPAEWVGAVGRDLAAHKGSSIVVAGEHQPPLVHALAHAINAALGNVGKTVTYTESIEANPVNQLASLQDLVNDLNAGQVDFLVIIGANPVYDAPADLNFASAMLKARLRVHSGLYLDETAYLSHWHCPAAHTLESWTDGRAYDGTVGIAQPLIAPLYDSHSAHELIGLFTSDMGKSGHDIVRAYWQSQRSEKDKAFEAVWETSLHDGVVAGTALPAISVAPHADFVAIVHGSPAGAAPGLEVVFRPDPAIGDGEWANSGWLQELPKPITRITWDNAAFVGPGTATQLGLNTNDFVTITVNGGSVNAGVFIVPGHADNSVTLHLGYGRTRAGQVGNGPGFNAYLVRTSSAMNIASGAQLSQTGKKYSFASQQAQYTISVDKGEEESVAALGDAADTARGLVRIATFEEFKKDPAFAQYKDELETKDLTMYPRYKYDGYAWGMSIDLNRCVGCNACVIACQSENNIAVVGKDQVERGRAMHWIRIDTYFRGSLENPEMYYEPLPCQQCENAPCEYVCPVGATTHNAEGLNDMTYNRCVGTRYCSNNCPYKVRRFNFFLYSDYKTPSLYGMRNPNVTVRSRGVMEKCTYCVQRINAAKIKSEEENRLIRDGEIITACQSSCPTEAIVFGNINDPNSKVSKLKAQTRDYSLLDDLNTRPRTTYLARVRNPNPEIHG